MTFTTDTRTIGHPIRDLSDKLTSLVRNRRRRRGLNRLRDLEDHMLHDIGVTRAEVEIATRLPLSVNAAEELRRMSLERRRNRM